MVAAAGALVLVLALSVLPLRSWMSQKEYRRQLERQAADLTIRNDNLQDRAEDLSTTAEIERIARTSYQLIRPGEEAYVILPDNQAPPEPPPPAPEPAGKQGFLGRTWDRVTSLF